MKMFSSGSPTYKIFKTRNYEGMFDSLLNEKTRMNCGFREFGAKNLGNLFWTNLEEILVGRHRHVLDLFDQLEEDRLLKVAKDPHVLKHKPEHHFPLCC